jgi:hypothetical protein
LFHLFYYTDAGVRPDPFFSALDKVEFKAKNQKQIFLHFSLKEMLLLMRKIMSVPVEKEQT